MNIDEASAKLVVERVVHAMDLLNQSAGTVREKCDEATFSDYQLKAAILISNIEDELLKPIYRQYLHLRPY